MDQPSLLCNRLDYSQFDWWLFLLQLNLIPKDWKFLWGAECSNFPGISVEVQDMVNDVDIDGDECASFMLLVSGSCGTWSSSYLAAGRIPRRPHLFIRPQHPPVPSAGSTLVSVCLTSTSAVSTALIWETTTVSSSSLRVQVQVERKALVGQKTRVRRKARVRR